IGVSTRTAVFCALGAVVSSFAVVIHYWFRTGVDRLMAAAGVLLWSLLHLGAIEALHPGTGPIINKRRTLIERVYSLDPYTQPRFVNVPRGQEAEPLAAMLKDVTFTPRPTEGRLQRCRRNKDDSVDCRVTSKSSDARRKKPRTDTLRYAVDALWV